MFGTNSWDTAVISSIGAITEVSEFEGGGVCASLVLCRCSLDGEGGGGATGEEEPSPSDQMPTPVEGIDGA